MQNLKLFDKNVRGKLHDVELIGAFLGMTAKA